MKFGKVADLTNVDFNLSKELYLSSKLSGNKHNTPLKLHIGCTGWSMPDWKGEIYPSKAKASEFLSIYSNIFQTVEFNSSFYTIPKKEQIIKWYDESADGFIFCPKINRSISQSKDLGMSGDRLETFIDSIILFQEKLGPCFMQLPEYFDTKRWSVIDRFLSTWPSEIPLSVEFRNSSWFDQASAKKDLLQLFESHNQTVLMTDVAGFRVGVHQIYSSEYAIVRWVGNNLHPTDYERLDEWVNMLQQLQSKGIKDVYFLIHEPDNVLAPKISSYLYESVSVLPNITVMDRVQAEPDQLKLF